MEQSSSAAHRQSKMKKVQKQLENWRKTRKAKKSPKTSPIPEHLWMAAVGLHGEYSIAEISKALRLDRGKLKKLILKGSKQKEVSSPAFIELDISKPQPGRNEWAIEMENADGDKMKISGSGLEIPDFALICQNFLGGKR